jgi:hypothetical protein
MYGDVFISSVVVIVGFKIDFVAGCGKLFLLECIGCCCIPSILVEVLGVPTDDGATTRVVAVIEFGGIIGCCVGLLGVMHGLPGAMAA